MNNILVKWDEDWADEFDYSGFIVLSSERWDMFMKALDSISYPVECSFGTNEYYDFENKNDIMHGLSFLEIDETIVENLEKCFGRNYKGDIEFGWTPVDQILRHYEEKLNTDG